MIRALALAAVVSIGFATASAHHSSPSRAARCGRWRCRPTAAGCSPSTRPTTGWRSSPSIRRTGELTHDRLGAGRPRAGRGRGAHQHRGLGRQPPLRQRQHRRRRRHAAARRAHAAGRRRAARHRLRRHRGGNRAFITTAHRGQNIGPVDPQLTTPGVGRADVWVFDATNLGATLGGTPLTHRRRSSATRRARSRSTPGRQHGLRRGLPLRQPDDDRHRGRGLRRRRRSAGAVRRRPAAAERCPAGCRRPTRTSGHRRRRRPA